LFQVYKCEYLRKGGGVGGGGEEDDDDDDDNDYDNILKIIK
jgi:hypothetical protein